MIIRRQNRLMRDFVQAGAVSPDKARPLADLGQRESWVFRRMVAAGVFIDVGEGRWYLDQAGAEAFRKRRGWKIFIVVVVGAILLVAVSLTTCRG